jgi:diguanylate cyclase (GGDEF)-like protein
VGRGTRTIGAHHRRGGAAATAGDARRRHGTGLGLLRLAGIGVPVALFFVTAFAVGTLFFVTRDAFQTWADRLATAVADAAGAAVASADAALEAVAKAEGRRPGDFPALARDPAAAAFAARLPEFSPVTFLDHRGAPLGPPDAAMPAGAAVPPPWFPDLAAGAAERTVVPAAGGKVVLARRLVDQAGRFVGVAVTEVSVVDLLGPLETLNLGSGGRVEIRWADGTAIGSTTPAPSLPQPAALWGLLGPVSITVDRSVEGWPMTVAVTVASGPPYARLLHASLIVVVVVGLLCFGLVVAAMLLRREFCRRWAAEERLAELVATDPLTGLLNRRGFEERLARDWPRIGAERAGVAFLVVDADEFKGFNDRYGHAGGDAALRGLARLLAQAAAAAGGFAARFGGEEFVVVMPEVAEGEAHFRAEAIRADVASAFAAKGFTVSVGGAWARASDIPDAALCIAAADAALYAAKGTGRNRVVFHVVDPAAAPAATMERQAAAHGAAGATAGQAAAASAREAGSHP